MVKDNKILENIYTSTGVKLLKHLDRLHEFQKNGVLRPVTLQIAPTDRCNLSCAYCSVKNRDGDEIPFDNLLNALDQFIDLGILSAEITGGGDPTLYPKINELISYLTDRQIQIGLITNGVALTKKIEQDNLDRLTWLRISMSFIDAEALKNNKIEISELDIPKIKGTLGLSYVWNDESTIEKLERIAQYAERANASFVRIVPNCLNVNEQKKYKARILPIMKNFPNFFFQTKDYDVYPKCMIGWLKPYLNADGYIYHCSANPLLMQKFHPKFRICHMSEAKKVWQKPFYADISLCEKGKCFYSEQNRLIDTLTMEIPHQNFI